MELEVADVGEWRLAPTLALLLRRRRRSHAWCLLSWITRCARLTSWVEGRAGFQCTGIQIGWALGHSDLYLFIHGM